MSEDTPLPKHGSRLRCLNNTDRPELVVGEIYTVVHEPDLAVCPINYARWQPEDFRLIAIRIPGSKENGIFPFGCFEEVKS